MISKEEIEEAKECLKETVLNTYVSTKAIKLNNAYKYIEQLENKLKKYELETIPQLQGEMDIIKKALNMQTIGWNEGARLYAEKQKLIAILEKANKEDTEKVKYHESAYRCSKEINNTFYMKSHRRTIDMANARREVRKSILSMIKEREVK